MENDAYLFDPLASVALLSAYDIPLAKGQFAATLEEALRKADQIGYPVALKGISEDYSHKSEAGLVYLGLPDPQSVGNAISSMQQKVPGLDSFLVQEMVPGIVEMFVGVIQDIQFGPVVSIGAGGVMVELLDDVVMCLPPLGFDDALEMIGALKIYPVLQGYRGEAPVDIIGLAELLVNVSRLAIDQGDKIQSLDLNPVKMLAAPSESKEYRERIKVVDYRIFRMFG